MHNHFRSTWQQGEHVAVIGPTGCGKSTFLSKVLDVRSSVAVLVTKVHDETLKKGFPGYKRIPVWPPPKAWDSHVLLWPEPVENDIPGTYRKQRAVFANALNHIFTDREWCVVFDEQHYVCKKLGLEQHNEMLLHQGRSSGLSVVNGTQRPAWVPVVTYPSSTHALIWRTTHRDDLKRLAELGGVDMHSLQQDLLRLDKHSFIYVNTRRGDIFRSQVRR